MPHYIRHRLESPLVLVTGSDFVALGLGAILAISEQDRDLSAQFCELKRACKVLALFNHSPIATKVRIHAINVIQEPAVAPAAPKQATDVKLGNVPLVLTWVRTSMPKFLLSQFE